MGIKLNASFDVMSPVPLDSRTVLTKEQMRSIDDTCMPPIYYAVCSEDGTTMYIYDKSNEANESTGKFRPISTGAGTGGSGGTGEPVDMSNIYTKTEVDELIKPNSDSIAELDERVQSVESVISKPPVYPEDKTKVSLDTTIDKVVNKKGDSIESAILSLSITKGIPVITKIALYINNVLVKDDFEINLEEDVSTYNVDYTHTEAITTDTTFEFRVYDSIEINYASIDVVFVEPSYFGAVESVDTETIDISATLTETLLKDKSFNWENITESNKIFCYAYPASLGDITSIKDENSFNMLYFFNKASVMIGETSYNLYYSSSTASLENGRLIFD